MILMQVGSAGRARACRACTFSHRLADCTDGVSATPKVKVATIRRTGRRVCVGVRLPDSRPRVGEQSYRTEYWHFRLRVGWIAVVRIWPRGHRQLSRQGRSVAPIRAGELADGGGGNLGVVFENETHGQRAELRSAPSDWSTGLSRRNSTTGQCPASSATTGARARRRQRRTRSRRSRTRRVGVGSPRQRPRDRWGGTASESAARTAAGSVSGPAMNGATESPITGTCNASSTSRRLSNCRPVASSAPVSRSAASRRSPCRRAQRPALAPSGRPRPSPPECAGLSRRVRAGP